MDESILFKVARQISSESFFSANGTGKIRYPYANSNLDLYLILYTKSKSTIKGLM